MSHQSGITANEALRGKFAQMKDGQIRVVVVVIENETLVVKEEREVEGTFEEDFDKLIPSLVELNRPAYYFVRLDTVSEISGHNWLLLAYIPDTAKVREKMLYASTAATLKREFGSNSITEEVRTSLPNEMTFNHLEEHRRMKAAAGPKSDKEMDMDEIRIKEMTTHIHVKSQQQNFQGLAFPLDEKVTEALDSFKQQTLDYLQLDIDPEKELIQLSHSEANISPDNIRKCLPENAGRYHIYRFKHDFNGDAIESLFFLYSVPGHGAKIKQRMVYASCKESVIEAIEKQLEVAFDRKLELSDISDLTTDYLFEQLHPEGATASAAKPSFEKPTKAPTSRGARRLIKTTDNPDE